MYIIQVQRFFRLGFLCCLLLVSACTSTTFVYNRLDFLLPWYVDDYADLSRAQDQYLDELLEPFLSWHRSQELPRYVELLDQVETKLEQPIETKDIEAIASDFQVAWTRLESESLDWLLALGEELNDEQIEGFLEVVREQQVEYEEKYLPRSDEEFYQDSHDNMLENATQYVGKLSESQLQSMKTASSQLQRSDIVWLRERASWLDELTVFLEREPGWQQKVRDAIKVRSDSPAEDYEKIFAHNMSTISGFVVALANDMSEKQEQHLRKELAELRSDLNTLIAQGKSDEARSG